MADQCTSAALKLDIKDVLDFSWCPKYYELKNKNPNERNLKEAYDIALHKCFYQYLLALQNDTLDGLKTLKYRWGKEWVKQKTNSELICTPSAVKRDTYDAKRKAGIDAIITFDKLMSTPQFPILVNREYSIQIDDVILTGTWEYIREIEIDGRKVIQLMKFRTENNRFQVVGQMSHDLELTAAALAFSKAFNQNNLEFQLVYVDIYKKKMMVSYRTSKDFELLKETVTSVAKCIKNDIKCISPDKRCYHCEYRDVCTASL